MVILRFLYIALFFASVLFGDVAPSQLTSGGVVVPHDKAYYKHKDTKSGVELIYTKENIEFAQHTLNIEKKLNDDYKKFYGWKLDETLYVGLISSNNQIPNGFSTQWITNRQINYLGGTQMVDYFTSTSWLDTLLYHETAHNYQINAKGSKVSQVLHSIFKNGSFIIPFVPIAVPNDFENSFMLEGNAVLNESWHGNGGRLYSGRFFVQTLLQAKSGNVKPSLLYNQKIGFPYSDNYYIVGGFYNLYMAKRYGLKSINGYFLNYSKHWYWPFLTNRSMYNSTGINFEDSIKDFSSLYSDIAKNVILAKGNKIASSQCFYPLNSDKDEIFFITNPTGVRKPELVVVDKKDLKIKKDADSWVAGKVLKYHESYFTQGSRYTSVTKIQQGLFDRDGFIKKDTASKMIQGYLSDKTKVYFDVVSSYSQPQLYVGKTFYAQVNSSVFIDKNDNLYYFKQDGKTRTLYKNKQKLFSYKGFYGIVSDVDADGAIYFIANSKFGSTLYKYDMKKIKRVSKADNVIDAKLVDDNRVLVSAIGEKEYYYVIDKLTQIDEKPFEVKLFFEDKDYYASYVDAETKLKSVDLSNPYHSVLDMHYHKTDLSVGYVNDATVGALNIEFGDTLSQNAANIFINRDDSNVTIAGVGYSNSQYLLNYTFMLYSVVDDNDRRYTRDSGIIASAELPFYRAGYYYGSLSASFYQDYSTLEREPVTLSLNFSRSERFGYSMYTNYLNAISIYGVKERDDDIYGLSYMFKHDLAYEFYFSLGLKHSRTTSSISDLKATNEERGVKVTSDSFELDMDKSSVSMPNIANSNYFKEVSYGELSLSKVFNFSSYFFTFPLSLQRESIYTKYRYYNLKRFDETRDSIDIDEVTIGTTFATVLFNNLQLPLSFEYIYNNDDSGIVQNRDNFRVSLGFDF